MAGIPGGERGEVHQHAAQALDLFLKVEEDPAFYAFFNESYAFPGWRHPHYRFSEVEYEGAVTVMYRGRREILKFSVSNPSAAADDFEVKFGERYSLDRFDGGAGGSDLGITEHLRTRKPTRKESSASLDHQAGGDGPVAFEPSQRPGFLLPLVAKMISTLQRRTTISGWLFGKHDDPRGFNVDSYLSSVLGVAIVWFLLVGEDFSVNRAGFIGDCFA